MKIPLPHGLLLTATFLAVTVVLSAAPTASAQSVIYRETFYFDAPNNSFAVWGGSWNLFSTRTNVGATNVADRTSGWTAMNGTANGWPTNLPAVNAGTYAGTALGFSFITEDTARQGLAYTTEYLIATNLSTPSLTSASWYAANASTTNTHRVAVRIGNQWYVSDTTYSTAAFGGFSPSAEQKTMDFTTNPTFRTLSFTIGSTPFTIGGTAAILPTGPVTAWGLFLDTGGSGGNNRFDTFEVQGFDAPGWAMISNFTNGLGTTNASGTNTVSGTINLTGVGGSGGNLFSQNAGAVLDVATNIVGDGALAINRNFTNTAGVTNSPTGTVRFSGTTANTYTNATTVFAGTLELIKSAGVNALAGNVTVNSNATLLISASNQVANTSTVTLSNGTLVVATNGSLAFKIGDSGTNNAIVGTGNTVLDGSFAFDLTTASTNTNATWTIVANTLTNTYGTNFLVSGFDGVAGGNWTNTTNGVSYVFSQTNGVLSVQSTGGVTPYNAWVAYWTNAVPGFTNTDGTADPDGDTFINNVEFVFDGNPTVGTPALLTAVKSGTNAIFNYVALTNTNAATYAVQFTTNLTNGWTNASVTISNSTNQDGINLTNDYRRQEFIVPANANEFYRVQSTINP